LSAAFEQLDINFDGLDGIQVTQILFETTPPGDFNGVSLNGVPNAGGNLIIDVFPGLNLIFLC
jgi:hypothetical protein